MLHLQAQPSDTLSHAAVNYRCKVMPSSGNLINAIPGPGSAPRNVQVRPLSSSTMVIQWDEPQDQNGLVTVSKDSLTPT